MSQSHSWRHGDWSKCALYHGYSYDRFTVTKNNSKHRKESNERTKNDTAIYQLRVVLGAGTSSGVQLEPKFSVSGESKPVSKNALQNI